MVFVWLKAIGVWKEVKRMSDKTSCSDNEVYPRFCELASSDERVFASFRRDPVYRGVVETVQREAGHDYLNKILLQSKALSIYFKEFKKNDLLGKPQVFTYRYGFLKLKKIAFSPTTLRYIKVLADLQALFDSLNHMRIVEIGGGYGGQCAIISRLFNPALYTIVDLEPCLKLTRRYLESLGIHGVNYVTMRELDETYTKGGFDLVISNYAFSELSRSVQDEYVSKIISGTSRGYFLCNFSTHTWEKEQYSEYEMVNLRPDSLVFKKYPPLSNIDIQCNISLIVFGTQLTKGWKPEKFYG